VERKLDRFPFSGPIAMPARCLRGGVGSPSKLIISVLFSGPQRAKNEKQTLDNGVPPSAMGILRPFLDGQFAARFGGDSRLLSIKHFCTALEGLSCGVEDSPQLCKQLGRRLLIHIRF
jgi:hypothetical protein